MNSHNIIFFDKHRERERVGEGEIERGEREERD